MTPPWPGQGLPRAPSGPSPKSNVLSVSGDRIRPRGVAIEKPPAANPEFEIYHFFFRDPNGYLLEIQRFDDPRW
jgi:catechol 2,3-dioxygenase-like lactoylglutathione lyase family enzyme